MAASVNVPLGYVAAVIISVFATGGVSGENPIVFTHDQCWSPLNIAAKWLMESDLILSLYFAAYLLILSHWGSVYILDLSSSNIYFLINSGG